MPDSSASAVVGATRFEEALGPAAHIEGRAAPRRRGEIAYPDERFAPLYARLQAALQRGGQTIGTMDLLIATAALVDRAPLVACNRDEFRRVPGLDVIAY